MRFTMMCIGSTGDVRPYVLLGKELKNRGHQVKIATFESFREMIEKEGLTIHPISGSATDLMASIMRPGISGLAFLQNFEAAIRDIAPMLISDLQNACEDAEAALEGTMLSIGQVHTGYDATFPKDVVIQQSIVHLTSVFEDTVIDLVINGDKPEQYTSRPNVSFSVPLDDMRVVILITTPSGVREEKFNMVCSKGIMEVSIISSEAGEHRVQIYMDDELMVDEVYDFE